MGGQEGAELDEARLLGPKSGNRGLNLGIAAYRHGDRLDSSDPAAASNDARKFFPPAGAVSGLNMNAARLMPGAISFSRLSHLPPMAASMCVNPVMLPPGRGRPATNPEPTGSLTSANTIGMVLVARCNAAVTTVVEQKITSGCDPTSSVAKALARLDPVCPPLLEPHVAAVRPTQSRQFPHECRKDRLASIALGRPHQHADAAHLLGLLRM